MKLALAFVLAIAALAPAAVHADTDSTSAAKVPVARRLYDEGIEAANKGRWSVAHDRFKASYELAPRVATLFNLAGAQGNTNRLVEASESYRRFLRETSDGRYPELRAEATAQLEAIEKQIAQVTLDVTNIDADDVIAIDDVEFPHAALREPIPMNPGPHTAKITRGDNVIATRPITLAAGAAETLKLELPKQVALAARKPADPMGSTAGAPLRDDRQPRPRKSLFKSPWFWTAAGVVVAGGVTAAYLMTRPDDGVLVVR